MSQDIQFTALGPTEIGFYTSGDITTYQFGALLVGTMAGVQGACTNPASNVPLAGVQGFGTGPAVAGVYGRAEPGENGFINPGPGVWGQGGGGDPLVFPPPNNAIGVFGRGGGGNADGVQGVGSGTYSGVAGFGGPEAGTGAFGLGGAQGGPGVRGIGDGGENTAPGSVNGDGVGVYGTAGAAEGGVFSSGSGAPLRLVPSSTPIEQTSLMQTGQVGDLYLFSVATEVGTTGTYQFNTILWLCVSPAWQHIDNQALWAQVQLGDTIGG